VCNKQSCLDNGLLGRYFVIAPTATVDVVSNCDTATQNAGRIGGICEAEYVVSHLQSPCSREMKPPMEDTCITSSVVSVRCSHRRLRTLHRVGEGAMMMSGH